MEEGKKRTETATATTARYKVVGRHTGGKAGKYIALVVLLLIGCFTAGLGGGYIASRLTGNSDAINTIAANGDGNAVVSQNEENISAVASKVGPSVVSILTTGQTQSIFGQSQTQEGAGSGIIISSDGYILTNKHVVAGSDQLSVITSDGTVYDNAKVLGTDPLNDLAFVKINATNLTAATLGDSSSVRIGENVVAIGNSLGQYQNTVTSGIISGTGRPVIRYTL